jgi:hypothetical protein
MINVSYNGQALPTQVRKLAYTRTERELVFSSLHAVDPSSYKAIAENLRPDNKVLTVGGGAYSETFRLNSGTDTPYTELVTAVEKMGERGDGSKMIIMRFSVRARLQTTIATGFRNYNFEWLEDEQGIYTLTITGEVTSKGTDTALSNFSAGIGAIEDLAKTALGWTGELDKTMFEAPQTFIKVDKNNGDITFSRTLRELVHPANVYDTSEAQPEDRDKRDSTIVFPIWSIAKVPTLRRGKDEPHITLYRIRWTARLQKSKSGFIEQYESKIKALIINRLKAIFSESETLVLESDEIDYARSGQTATGTWEVSSGEDLVSYSEILEAKIIVADSDKVLDGEDFTESAFSPGARLELVQRIVHVQRNTLPPVPSAPVVIFGGESLDMYLKEFDPVESMQIVGEEQGEGEEVTSFVNEYTLNWRAVYKAYAKPRTDSFRKVVSGGQKMNIQGKVIKPTE